LDEDAHFAKIRFLNDAFRRGERPNLGRIRITSGARHLVAAWSLGELILLNLVRKCDTFDEDNDHYQQHDFGSFEFAGEKLFWQYAYYDKKLEFGSEDPTDPEKCTRVLTISWCRNTEAPRGPLFLREAGTKSHPACFVIGVSPSPQAMAPRPVRFPSLDWPFLLVHCTSERAGSTGGHTRLPRAQTTFLLEEQLRRLQDGAWKLHARECRAPPTSSAASMASSSGLR
jgi:Protein of unknown function (DUF3768)